MDILDNMSFTALIIHDLSKCLEVIEYQECGKKGKVKKSLWENEILLKFKW